MDVSTKKVVEMYEKNPFPNYNGIQNKGDLDYIISKNKFVSDLKNEIGLGKSFIEVGSGTSQLSLSLAHGTNNSIIAFDSTLESLKLGKKFADINNIGNVSFVNADIFQDPFKEKTFDFVWSSGVLHHTKNSKDAFKIISKWLKPEGLIIIGLYNKFGRFRTHFRQKIYNFLGKGDLARYFVKIFDPNLRKSRSKEQEEAWIKDQYEHPIERSHTIDELLDWFTEEEIVFLGSIPDVNLDGVYVGIENMTGHKGNFLTRLISQIYMIFNNLGSEGGLFIVLGRKK